MSRNGLYAVIAILVVVVAGFAIYYFQQQSRPGVDIRIDEQGLQVDSNG